MNEKAQQDIPADAYGAAEFGTLDLMDLIFFVSGDPPEHELIAAAASGNLARIKVLTETGASPDAKHKVWGSTALHVAAERGHKRVVEYLISRGVRLNESDRNDLTPLMSACSAGQSAIALLLLNAGADALHERTSDGMNALKFALWGRCSARVQSALLARGAKTPAADFPVVHVMHTGGVIPPARKAWAVRILIAIGLLCLVYVCVHIQAARA